MKKLFGKIENDFRLMVLFTITIILLLSLLLGGCTKNQRTIFLGAQQEITLPPNRRLVDAHFNYVSLWILTEEMDSTYIPKTKYLTEKSIFFEGEVIFHENRK